MTKIPSAFSTLSPDAQRVAMQRAADRYRTLRRTSLNTLHSVSIELERRRLREYSSFVKHFWRVLEPKQNLSWNWHLDVLCGFVQNSRERSQSVIFNIPPGTMKSLLLSVFSRAWLWSLDPSLRFLCGSYGIHLSVRDNVKLRMVVESAEYKRLFPHVHLTEDQNQKLKFETSDGGWSIATSVGGPGTGEHPDYVIIDDPLTAQQAMSKAERESAISWLDGTISTRGISRNVQIWLVMQRLHEQDPTAHLLSKGGYHHVCFPMRFDTHISDPLDQRRKAGELLWPELFPEASVRKLEINLGPYGTAGQLQQRPAPEGGGLFKREWLSSFVDRPPAVVRRRCRGWDAAATLDGGDYCVGVRISEGADGFFYIEDVIRGQWSPAGVDATMASAAALDGKLCAIREEREGGSSGKSVIFARAKALLGFDYKGVPASGSKVTRAQPLRSVCEAGLVKLVRGLWNEEYIAELCAFPTAAHDDQVDGSSTAYNALLEIPRSAAISPIGVSEGASYWNFPVGHTT